MELPLHPSLRHLPDECDDWLRHAKEQRDADRYATDLQGYLDTPGRLSVKATNELQWLGHYYGVAACDAYARSDMVDLANYLRRAVAFNALELRWRGTLNVMYPEAKNLPSPFGAALSAAGQVMLSHWDEAAACAYWLIQIVHKDQRLNDLPEARRFSHGTLEAFLVPLFSQAFGIATHFDSLKPLVPEYQAILERWRTTDEVEFQAVMQAGAEFHISRSRPSTGSTFYEFSASFDRLFPAELLAVQALRRRDGLRELETGHLLIDAAWSAVRKLPDALPHPLVVAVETRLKEDFPLFR